MHVVAKGHTLGKIASRYHVSVQDLREVNGLTSSVIKPGLKLVIPDRGKIAEAKKKAAKLRKARDAEERARKAKKAAKKAQADATRRVDEYKKKPARPGFVRIRHNGEQKGMTLVKHGKVRTAALAELTKILRHRSGAKHAIDPALARLVARVSDHFGGRPLVVVSGFRPKTRDQFTAHSRHNVGKALDFTIEGVPNDVVRDFCMTLDGVGVGYYPNSGFVHLDARSKRHAWTDEARHGEAPRYVATRAMSPVSGSNKTHPLKPHVANIKGGKQKTPGQMAAKAKANGHSRPIAPESMENRESVKIQDRKKTFGKGTQ